MGTAGMKRRELEKALLTLETTPALLEQLLSGIACGASSRAARRQMARHLEGLAFREREFWGRWIELLLSESTPLLPEPDTSIPSAGEDAPEAFARFRENRERNLRLLRQAPSASWNCAGILERGGILYLRELPAAMAEGDRRDLEELLRVIVRPAPSAADGRARPAPLCLEMAHRP
jgi:hypothetical protein